MIRSNGRKNSCKDCNRIEYRAKRLRSLPKFKAKWDRFYSKHREEFRERSKKYYALNKPKIYARLKLRDAIKKGLIIRPKTKLPEKIDDILTVNYLTLKNKINEIIEYLRKREHHE